MATRTLRRRLHHGDFDGERNELRDKSGLDAITEPLLGKYGYDEDHTEVIFRFSIVG